MKALILCATCAMLAGSALAADNATTITAPSTTRRTVPPVNNAAQTEGGIQRGVRLGNPAQMFNPFASARYGDGREYVTERTETDKTLSPRETTRSAPVGLRLFSFSF